jgi:hypothetical protein
MQAFIVGMKKGTKAQRDKAEDFFFSLPFASLSLCPSVPVFT